jgi:hypothetical protein
MPVFGLGSRSLSENQELCMGSGGARAFDSLALLNDVH